MNKKKKRLILSAITAVMSIFTATLFVSTAPAYAADIQCSILPQDVCNKAKNGNGNVKDSAIMELLKLILRILTAGVGIVATGALVYAGIMYASASDNASQISQAKTIITNVVIGIIAYGLMVLIVNFLIPGGVFG